MNATMPERASRDHEVEPGSVNPVTVAASVSPAERDAVLAGINAADAALMRAERFKVLKLFVGPERSPRGDPRLDVLQAYAELRHALLPQGYIVPATSLLEKGFTAAKIAQFDAIIAEASLTRSE